MGGREDADEEVKTSRMGRWVDVLSEFVLCLVNWREEAFVRRERTNEAATKLFLGIPKYLLSTKLADTGAECSPFN